ncbi:DUF2235 domain-containing protein [Gallaecimonas mangrovi]|uniref:DUF2235 domain-containing protein n=1 Tax=Gallaecimonas mangrovi TaxID=2291597 RepID=UPI000E204FFD|nr:DUF2235 domain-containing protein [Gallaecimonas mangrovi]
MKRLILCCDGTWNNPEQEENGIPCPTNVYKISNAIASSDGDIEQLIYYHPGVGGEGSISGEGGVLAPLLGGALGVGIRRHLCSAYYWIAKHYQPGDQIYLFGFSRGAFTARSLSEFLGLGLLDLTGLSEQEAWARVHKSHDGGYQSFNENPPPLVESVGADWAFFESGQPLPIRFVGVWDTVGALGIPDDLEFLNLFDDKDNWRFYDDTIGAHVQTGRHAMAMDEKRSCFTVTHWSNAATHNDAKELWFPGVHSDVGGGYSDSALADGALQWMIKEASLCGLMFRLGVLEQLHPDSCGLLHDSFKGIFAKLRSRPRNVAGMVTENKTAFHDSAIERQLASPITYPPYWKTRMLKAGESVTVDVFADQRWNNLGLYVGEGQQFTFSAEGEWVDGKDSCPWTGTEDSKLTLGDMARAASSFFGKFESVFKKLSHNDSADLAYTKRIESLPWFCMVGAIANDGDAAFAMHNDGSPSPHQTMALPDFQNTPLTVQKPGYFYCFANDVWSLYGNNKGSIRLTVHCLA